MTSESSPHGALLDSWKAIATYLGRTVRTVQRWEELEGLPVHRHRHNELSTVYAFTGEIDQWKLRARLWAEEARHATKRRLVGIAVMPFESSGALESLADVLATAVARHLSQISALRVISRHSATAARTRRLTAKRMASEFGITYVVEGQVSSDEQRLVASLRLIDARKDALVWSDIVYGDDSDLLRFEALTAAAAVRALSSTIGIAANTAPPRVTRQVYECLARANVLMDIATPSAFSHAVTVLESGIAAAPDFPELYCALATWHIRAVLNERIPRVQGFENASLAARKALAIDQDLASAHVALGYLSFLEWNWAAAVDHLTSALQLEPSHVEAHRRFALYLVCAGDVSKAVQHGEIAVELDPLSKASFVSLANAHFAARDFEKSLNAINGALKIADHSATALCIKGLTELFLQRTSDSVETLSSAVVHSRRHSTTVAGLAVALTAARRLSEAHELAGELRRREDGGDRPESVAVAEVEVALGNTNGALAALERALAQAAGTRGRKD